MDKLKKLLCCLWSTPTAILIAAILFLYADRNEYIHFIDDGFQAGGGLVLVTNKWTGNACVISPSRTGRFYIKRALGHFIPCGDGVERIYLP